MGKVELGESTVHICRGGLKYTGKISFSIIHNYVYIVSSSSLQNTVVLSLRTIFNLFFPTLSHGCFPETPFVSPHSLPYLQSLPFVFLDIFQKM